jgi:hypothetical protein
MKKVVYILMWSDGEISGVYSTEELAEQARAPVKEYNYCPLFIVEYELDPK